MTFTVEDITSKADHDTFQRAGLNMQVPQITQLKDTMQELRQDYAYNMFTSAAEDKIVKIKDSIVRHPPDCNKQPQRRSYTAKMRFGARENAG